MKKRYVFLYPVLVFFLWLMPAFGHAQSCESLTRTELREMLVELGFTVKDLNTKEGEEKYEVSHTKNGYNIPIAYEISASTNFIWLTAFLGKPRTESLESNLALLKQNFKIQPCQFYITEKGNLMMGLAVENRGVTTAILRRHTDKIVANVSETVSLWQ